MHEWIESNVPVESTILATWQYSAQLAFLDGMKRDWSYVQRDCYVRNNTGDNTCLRSTTVLKDWPPPPTTFWLAVETNCNASGISLDGLLDQMRGQAAEYLLLTQEPGYETTLAWPNSLVRSGAFEIVRSTYLRRWPTVRQARGLVLLRRTGTQGRVQRMLMDAESVMNLVNCERDRHGGDYAEAIRSTFPQGIAVIPGTPGVETVRQEVRAIYAEPDA